MLLYIFWFLHQTTTSAFACTSFTTLYIFWFLHQTTTTTKNSLISCGCISFDSYIKPQLWRLQPSSRLRCISFDSYIKPQLPCLSSTSWWVVYLLIPTSNHNSSINSIFLLAVVYLLIPTSNHNVVSVCLNSFWLYIFWFLHQTTTLTFAAVFSITLYIFWFLHQTTTHYLHWQQSYCCISFDSYIKPQLQLLWAYHLSVVYLLIPTSNHNKKKKGSCFILLYIFWFLHQTTTFPDD